MKEILIFQLWKDTTDSDTIQIQKTSSSDEMFCLDSFLTSDVRNNGLPFLKYLEELNNSSHEGWAYDLTSIDKLPKNMLSIDIPIFPDIKPCIISWDNLITVTKKWIEIKSLNTKYVLIEHKNNLWDVRGGDDKEALLNS